MPSTAVLTQLGRYEVHPPPLSPQRNRFGTYDDGLVDAVPGPEPLRDYEQDGDDGAATVVIRGHVCAFSLYRIWTDGGPGAGDKSLNALCSLLFRRYDEDVYSVEYALTKFSAEATAEAWDLGQACSAASLAAMANEAAKPGQWPLTGLDRAPNTWKALYCAALSSLRKTLGGPDAFYTPIVLHFDPASGLIVRASSLSRERLSRHPSPTPVPGIVRVEGGVNLDPQDVRSAAARRDGEEVTLAFARVCALRASRRPCRQDTSRCYVEITTKDAKKFCKTYGEGEERTGEGGLAAPPQTKRARLAGGEPTVTSDEQRQQRPFFAVSERVLRLPDVPGGTVSVRSLVPTSFDCLVTVAEEFSTFASIAVYSRWYSAVHPPLSACERRGKEAGPRRLTPIFAYVGPEIYSRGEDRDYAFWPGFPGWQILKAPFADRSAVSEATSIYASTDGLWPMAGPRTFHALSPWHATREEEPPAIPLEALASLSSTGADGTGRSLAELTEQWPAGRVKCAFSSCEVLRDAELIKMDFAAFAPTLYLALYPRHRRLAAAVRCRVVREAPWLKRPLVEFCGWLKRVDPRAYDSVMNLANGVADAVETAAAALGFAMCVYVKDGFWGAFAYPPFPSAETLRVACERAANAFITETAALRFPEGVRLALRTEGTYTDAVSWNSGCYYLLNRRGGEGDPYDFVGFPVGNAFAADAREETAALLRRFLSEGMTPRELVTAADEACVRLVERAFCKRADADYWKASPSCGVPDRLPSEEAGRQASLLANSSLSDRGAVRGDHVKAVTTDGKIVRVACSAFPSPRVLPAIACEDHATPVFTAIIKLVDAVSASVSSGCAEEDEDEVGGGEGECEEDGGGGGESEEGDSMDATDCASEDSDSRRESRSPPSVSFRLNDYAFLFLANR